MKRCNTTKGQQKKSHGTQLHAHADGRKQGSRSWQQDYNNLLCACKILSMNFLNDAWKYIQLKSETPLQRQQTKHLNDLVPFWKLRQQKQTVSTSKTVPQNRTLACATFADAETDVENVLSLWHPPEAISSQVHPTGKLFSFHFHLLTCMKQELSH